MLESRKCLEVAWKIKNSFEFFLDFLELVMALTAAFHVCMIRFSFSTYRRMVLGQILLKKSLALMFQYLIEN